MLSVVVPTRDRPEMLARCAESVLASLGAGDELVVVDSASVTPIGPIAGARVIRVERPGASLARNVGWRAAIGEIVAFIDDDVCVDRGWAEAMHAAFWGNVAFVSGRIEMPPGVEHVRPVALTHGLEPRVIDLDTPTGQLGHSANLAVRRDVLVQIGGFDELLGAGGRFRAAEDLDLIDRILLGGRTGRHEPAALAWHDQWRTKAELVRLDWAYGTGMGVRIAKLRRTDRPRARRELRDALWTFGLRDVPHDAVRLYRFLTLTALSRVAGTLVGVARGMPRRVSDGHLVARNGRRRRGSATPS
ncbi:MAG: glycosyltransferase [Acidimicrobiales bacterium]